MKISAIYVSPGHNFFGRHGKPAGEHITESVRQVDCVAGRGIRGDRFWDYKRDYAGQVTFFDEAVHQRVLENVRPVPCSAGAYRRNLLIRGADLMALVGQEFDVQGVRFLGIGESKPCHWMEQAVGEGAEAFLRGNGGLRAKVLSDGVLRVDCALAAGVLLAGGKSQRMGQNKADLAWQGGTLGEHQATTLAVTGAWPLLLSCRSEQSWTPRSFERVEDRSMGAGVVGALTEAFSATDAEVLSVLAIDLPLVSASFLERLSGRARDAGQTVVPWHLGRFEPFAAAWHRSSVPGLERALRAGRSLQDTCAELANEGKLVRQELTPEEERQVANVNTPEDLARITAPRAQPLA
ncbi:MAG: molybdenum cofactor guanylyltransferase [Opitutus sp.]